MLAYLQTGWHYLWNILRPRHRLGWRGFVVLGVIVLAVVLVTSSVVSAADASWADSVVNFISDIILWVATLFLKLAIFCLTFIIEVAGYNGFLDSTAVNYGWVMVRDLTNMIFVVILLLIAFGTILGIEQYEWKKMLVKFVAAAILVNFSRIICGVIIDVGQVVMITFINGVAATAGGNLINAFGANEIMSLAEGGSEASKLSPTSGEVFLAAVMAVVFAGMMLMTMLVYLVILVARMIQLWVLIVLSPFAFVFSVIPTTQKYASEWWQKFGSNVVSGPIIAFFLWLSFVTVGQGTVGDEVSKATQVKKVAAGDESAGITKAMSWAKMANFAIAIGMLLVGAETAQKLGVTGGSMMSKVGDFGKKAAMIASGAALGKWVGGKAKQGGKYLGKGILMNAPLVGGNSWKARGAWAKNIALRTGTVLNKHVGSRLGAWAQFGGHEKVMKERKAQAEQLAANMSSSVKGRNTKFFGKAGSREGGIEALRAYTDRIQGEGAVMKEKSDAKRAVRKNVASERKLLDENGEITDAGKDYMKQMAKKDSSARSFDTAKIKIQITALGDKEIGAETIRTLGEREESDHQLTGERKRMLSAWKTGEFEHAVHEVRHDNEVVEAFNNDASNNTGASSEDHASQIVQLATMKKFRDGLAALYANIPAGTTNATFSGEIKDKFDKGYNELYNNNDFAEINKPDLTSMTNITGIESGLEAVDEAIIGTQHNIEAQRTLNIDSSKADEQIKLLQALLDAKVKGEPVNLSGFDAALVKSTTGQDAKNFDNQYLQRLQIQQVQRALEIQKDVKKHGTVPAIAAAKSKALGDEQSKMEALRGGELEEEITKRYLNKRRGVPIPSDAGLAAVDKFQARYKGMDRTQLLAGLKNFSGMIAKEKAANPGYSKSDIGKKDLYNLYGLIKQIHETRFPDDNQGLVEGHINEAISAAGGDKTLVNSMKRTTRREAGGNSGSGIIDFSSLGAGIKDSMKTLLKGIGMTGVHAEGGLTNDSINALITSLRAKNNEDPSLIRNSGHSLEQLEASIRAMSQSTTAGVRAAVKELVE